MAHLSLYQRQQIEAGIVQGKSNTQIAREIGVHRATVGREIKRNALSRTLYQADEAEQHAKITQRMAVSLRCFEGYGRLYCFSQERKEGTVPSGADFFQLDTYKRKPFILFPESSKAGFDRNRYTVSEKITFFSLFSVQNTFSFNLSTFNFDSAFRDYGNFSSVILPAKNLNLQTHSKLFAESTHSTTYDHRNTASNPQHFSSSQRLSSLISQELFITVEKIFGLPVIGAQKIKATSAQQESQVKTQPPPGKLSLKQRRTASKRKFFPTLASNFSLQNNFPHTFSKK